MHEIILKVLSGTASPKEVEEVTAWRARSEANDRDFREISRLWDLVSIRSPNRRDHRAALAAVLAQPGLSRRIHGRTAVTHERGVWGWRVATIAASLAVGFALAQFVARSSSARPGPVEVVTAAGEKASVLLPDGTVLRLGPKSRIRATSAQESREVTLEGDAYFAVAHDAERPFAIHTDAGDAVALGTRFEMRAREGEMLVTVVEGRVAMTAAGARVVLEAGDALRARADLPPEPLAPDEIVPAQEWLGPFAAYQSTPLREVARELGQRFGLQVSFTDASLEERTITAWFPDSDLESMLSVICRVTNVECTRAQEGLTIGR